MATELIGYSDKFSVAPGDKLAFKVSTDLARFDVAIVRLLHGDENPAGPGFKEEVVSTPVNGAYPGRRQKIHCGSWLTVPDRPALRGMNSLTLQAWVFPTGTDRGERQGLISKGWSTEPAGYGLGLGPGGDLELRVGCPDGQSYSLSTGRALRGRHWYFVAATIDLSIRRVLKWRKGGPRHLASDLYLVDWLEAKGFDCDVITDEDLHRQGLELLRDYRVLLTGTHPEYATGAMLSALEQYLGRGGGG